MADDDMRTTELREELRLLAEEIAVLRRTAQDLRRQIGEQRDAPWDAQDLAALITQAEEQEFFLAELEARRDALLRKV
jgi:hypothetical protein